ncbi:hypothetical protein TASCI_70014 [Tenacibaculum ascidiaceicola]
MLTITKNGTNNPKTERKGIVCGDTYGSTYDSNKTAAKTELIKNKNLLAIENFFI